MTTKNNVGLRSGSTKEKIAQLSSLLSSKTARDAAARDRAETVLASEVANALLEKAPAEFLQIRTIEQLAEIATRCSADCEKFLASATEYLVSLGHVDGLSYLTVVLSDRPFIINTIQEVLRSHHIEASSFLYSMIFLKNGARLSVNYLELPRLTEEAKQALGSNLQHSLAELVIVTDHFSEMLARTETLARFIMEPAHAGSAPEGERQELADFLRWLINGGFVFLGLAEWERDPNSLAKTSHVLISQKPSLGLGLLTPQYQRNACLVEELAPIIQNLVSSPELLSCSKLPTHALAHKHERIDQISIKQFGSDGRLQRIFTILGLFTSQARMQEASSVPLIRRKFQRIVELEQLLPNTHNYKAALNIFDSLPREELIRSSLDELMRELNIIRNSQRTLEPYVSLRPDSASQCMAAVIAIPRNRFDESVRARLQNYLETALGAESDASSYHLGLNSRSLAIIAFNVPVSRSKLERISLQTLTDEIQRLTISWRERLEVALKERYPDMNMFQELMHRYGDVFSPEYRASQTIEDSLHDIRFLETLTSAQPYRISLVTSPGLPTASAQLVLYSLDREITISQFFPILERVGLFVESERAIRLSIQGKGAAFIHRFEVRSAANQALDTKRFEQTVAPGLIEILNGTRENDRLNSLLFSAGLSSKHIALLRTYCAYAWQISGFASREAIQDALINFPEQARLLTDLFSLKFDPSRAESIAERRTKFAAELLTFKVSLRAVTDITKDRILRVFANLIDATVRTNFFSDQSVIAFKIHSAAVEIMPLPKPHFEIFMSGVHLEGIHLRGGKVARGGIRWSDRKEDYRYEVLGLMKTQKIKNALIVPTGAKGGFIIKRAIRVDEQPAQVAEEVYKDFIRSLLSLTDNRIGETIVHPKGLIIYDELDPYLVVAADKGTATFSDTANRIAVEEFDFWLGDAFASGGSNGYDHKKYAITARGGWEAVKRHFNDMGRDIEHESFTAIGIGDMSGDVFGNGLLLSRTIKLLAAFNHAHIFVDPNPDPEISFTERKRMFEKPRSQWTDYNRALLSKGGNIFNRLDKEIEITPEVRAALHIDASVPSPMSGEQLVHAILKADVDLFWNGGIGTYVKSSGETHANVNDGTNDAVRVNATDLRCKVVGEGGNLGFTQLARIEFNQRGGRLNTDAIDNSGGVDLSDHEVNFKVLFAKMMREKKINLADRNALLKEMATDACELVVADNYSQALLLTLGALRSGSRMTFFKSLIRELTRNGFLNRTIENIPDDEEIGKRANRKIGLFRPELAVLLSAVKMWLKEEVLKSALHEDPIAQEFLYNYFPKAMRDKFRDEIARHPLAPEITATQVINNLVDTMGVTFVYRTAARQGAAPAHIVRVHLAAEKIIGARKLRQDLSRFDTPKQNRIFLQTLQDINKALYQLTSWLIAYHPQEQRSAGLVERYGKSYEELIGVMEQTLKGTSLQKFQTQLTTLKELGLSVESARTIAALPFILRSFGMLWAAEQSQRDLREVGTVYGTVLEALQLNRVLEKEELVEPSSEWESELLLGSYSEIRKSLALLTGKIIAAGAKTPEDITIFLEGQRSIARLQHFIRECREEVPTVAAVAVIANQFRLAI